MRHYKLFIEGDTCEFTQEVEVANEHEAREFARKEYPTFTLTLCVEILNPEAA